MAAKCFYITGTDTGVGKTVLTVLLTRQLRARGLAVAALKPLCSGGREDAEALHLALGGELSLDAINPWHFRLPLAPLLAARQEGKRVQLRDALAHVRQFCDRRDVLLIEGAGGLLSPLGEDFTSRELIIALRSTPIIVSPNRLGAVNQVMLTLAALPPRAARSAKIVLVSPSQAHSASRSNVHFLEEKFGANQVFVMPWFANPENPRLESSNLKFIRALLDTLALG